jgi:hypothetical protein
VEVGLDESLVRIGSSSGKVLVVDNTGPNGGEGKEDTDDRENMSNDLRQNVCELKRREDSYKCVRYISILTLTWANVPGMNMV